MPKEGMEGCSSITQLMKLIILLCWCSVLVLSDTEHGGATRHYGPQHKSPMLGQASFAVDSAQQQDDSVNQYMGVNGVLVLSSGPVVAPQPTSRARVVVIPAGTSIAATATSQQVQQQPGVTLVSMGMPPSNEAGGQAAGRSPVTIAPSRSTPAGAAGAGSTWSVSPDSMSPDDSEELAVNMQQIGNDPFTSSVVQRPGRRQADKFPYPQCANTTLTFDVAFIGQTQYLTAGSIRFAFHRFGPLDDAPGQAAAGGPRDMLKRKPSPVVFISGWGTSMYIWPVPLLKALAATRTVIIVDNIRTGGSTDSSKTKLTIPLMADGMAAFIQKLGLSKPDIWSWSLGAAVGYALLARHADKIGHAVLAAGTPGGSNALLPPANVWQQARAVDHNYHALLTFLFPLGASDPGVCNFYAAFNSFADARQLGSPVSSENLDEQGAALRAFFNDNSVVSKLKSVTNRVLILHGVQDRLMPVGNAVLGAQHLLGSWMLQLPEDGHGVPFSNVAGVIAMTTEFFALATPLNSSTLRIWSTYGQTQQQQQKAAGR